MAVKLWLIVGGGGKIMAGRGWSQNLVMPIADTSFKVTGTEIWKVVKKSGFKSHFLITKIQIFSTKK